MNDSASTLFDVAEVPTPTKSNEWYTPSRYIEAAREVMGGIDLDPASCEMANRTVKATKYYTKEDNGLEQEWHGRVWLNPPYGLTNPLETNCRFKSGGASPEKRSLQSMFIAKALSEYRAGNIEQCTLLVTANTTVAWFQPLWDYPMCTPYPKMRFFVPGLSEGQSQVFGNVFVYLGPHEQKFTQIFSKFGRIVRAIDTPKLPAIQPTLFDKGITA